MAKDYFKRTSLYIDIKDKDDFLRWRYLAGQEDIKLNPWLINTVKEAVNVKYPKNSKKGARVISFPNTETPRKTALKKLRMMSNDQLSIFEPNADWLATKALAELRRRLG